MLIPRRMAAVTADACPTPAGVPLLSPYPSTTPPVDQDVYKTAQHIKAAGGNVTRDAGPVPGIGTKITACLDPGRRGRTEGPSVGSWEAFQHAHCTPVAAALVHLRATLARPAHHTRSLLYSAPFGTQVATVVHCSLLCDIFCIVNKPTSADGYKIVFVDNEDFLKELEQK